MVVVNGTISSAHLPDYWPAATRCWLIREYSSWASRLTLYRAATISAVSIMDRYSSGLFCLIHSLVPRNMLILSFWHRLMDSTPPATIAGIFSLTTRWAAMAMDCRPELQKRLID